MPDEEDLHHHILCIPTNEHYHIIKAFMIMKEKIEFLEKEIKELQLKRK